MSKRDSSRGKEPSGLPLIGAQVSTAGGFGPVPERAQALGAEVVQVFSSNPRIWKPRTPQEGELDTLAAGLEHNRIPLFFHSIYLINLATPDAELRTRSVDSLAYSLTLGALTRAAGVVTHIGSHRGAGLDVGRSLAAEALRETVSMAANAVAHTGRAPLLPPLLLETSSGAGNSVGGRLEDLAAILEQTSVALAPEAIGVCIDTAHLHAAGYAVHEADGLEIVIEHLARLDLLARTGLVHLNDSASSFGSTRDLHENPGDGSIGYDGLERLVRHPALAHIPFVLETPGTKGHGPDRANLVMVKSMRAGRAETAARRASRAARAADGGPPRKRVDSQGPARVVR